MSSPRRASVCTTELSPRQIPRLVSMDEGRSLLAVARRGSDSCRSPASLIRGGSSPNGSGGQQHLLGVTEFRVPLQRSSSVDARCYGSSSWSPPADGRPSSAAAARPSSPMLLLPPSSSSSSSTTAAAATAATGDVAAACCSPGAASPIGTIQPELYKKSDLLVLDTPDAAGAAGRLHLRLKYDLDRSDLIVHVIEAHDLAQPELGGFSDPYVEVSLLPRVDGKLRLTAVRHRSLNPFFNAVFAFPVARDELSDRTLLLQLFDGDKLSHNDTVGEVRLAMRDVDVTSELEVWSGITRNKKPAQEKPELLLSLNYLPSAERLTVVVVKARNLVAANAKDAAPDPYVKVYLLHRSKRVKKKKTSVRRASSNPVWNEAMAFNVAADALSRSSLEVVVHSHDLLSNTTQLGACTLGPDRQGVGHDHWQDMTRSVRQSVAMWHVLD